MGEQLRQEAGRLVGEGGVERKKRKKKGEGKGKSGGRGKEGTLILTRNGGFPFQCTHNNGFMKDHNTPKNECLYFPPISFFTLVFISSL